MRKIFLFSSLALSVASLTACQTIPVERVADAQPMIFIPSTPTVKALESYDWKFVGATIDEPKTRSIVEVQTRRGAVTLNFNQNRMNYSVGCNQLSSQYSLSENTLQPIGTGVSTLMACGELQAAEQWLAKQMQRPSELNIMELETYAALQQTTSDGTDLNWHGTLKPEVKYGKGETVFLEVKPKWQYCDNVTNRKCLEVRDIQYDAQGLKTAVGKWQLLDAPIMGYRHDESAQRVLRLTRYRTPPTDTKGYGRLYVLDRVTKTNVATN